MKNRLVSLVSILLITGVAACGGIGESEPTPAPTLAALEMLPDEIVNATLALPPGGAPPVAGEGNQNTSPEQILPFLAGNTAAEVITDFSEIQSGMAVTLSGTLSLVDDAYVLVDEQGNTVRVNLAPPLVQAYNGQQIELAGLVLQSNDGLVMQTASLVSSGGEASLPFPLAPPNNTSNGAMNTTLTALQAYDQLIAEGGADLEGLTWVGANGNAVAGWVFSFYSAVDNTAMEYVVRGGDPIEGRTVPVGSISTVPLDRSTITVDSPAVLQAVGIPVPGAAILSLSASEESGAQWHVIGTDTVIDATNP